MRRGKERERGMFVPRVNRKDLSKLMTFSGSWAQYSSTGVQKLKIFPPTIMNLYRKQLKSHFSRNLYIYTLQIYCILYTSLSISTLVLLCLMGIDVSKISNFQYFQRPGSHTKTAAVVVFAPCPWHRRPR